MTVKLYNPKSHAPAAYIPAWLIQIPSDQLSLSAKILYGRLAQWANTKSQVHRSTKQLALELGVDQRVIKRFLAELREVKLIKTYQANAGGENYYQFLDHPWIHASLLSVFDWSNNNHQPRDENVTTPVTKTSLPSDENVTPKVKEIKINKKELKNSCSSDDERTDDDENLFNKFWEAYPKKVGRKAALKAWKKGKLEKDANSIIADVHKRKDHNWRGKEKQHIPDPSTYLNGEKWNDELFIDEGISKNESKAEKSFRILTDIHNKALNDEREKRRKENPQDLDIDPLCPFSVHLG